MQINANFYKQELLPHPRHIIELMSPKKVSNEFFYYMLTFETSI